MPELPEVETIKLGLQKKIVGLRIKKIQVIAPKSFLGNPSEVEGKKVIEIWRRAKVLGIDLSFEKGISLLFHLKMSGQVIYEGKNRFIGGHPTQDMFGSLPNSHTRVIFTFSDNSHLYFNDQRRFGWVRVIKSSELGIINNGFFGKLGPEPLDRSFSWEMLKENLLKHKKTPIKVALLDQSVVAGVGNIYASEACFDAKIDPRIKVGNLGDRDFKAIHKGVIKVIKSGIKYGGASRAHFVDSDGHKGYFLDYAFVYGRVNHPCKKCGTKIKKITLGGRGTFLCPNCQKGYN